MKRKFVFSYTSFFIILFTSLFFFNTVRAITPPKQFCFYGQNNVGYCTLNLQNCNEKSLEDTLSISSEIRFQIFYASSQDNPDYKQKCDNFTSTYKNEYARVLDEMLHNSFCHIPNEETDIAKRQSLQSECVPPSKVEDAKKRGLECEAALRNSDDCQQYKVKEDQAFSKRTGDLIKAAKTAEDNKNKAIAKQNLEDARNNTVGVLGIPKCLFAEKLSDDCRDVGIFVIFLINVARYLFSIIGALALLVFVYGGFELILSEGSQEKIQTGTGAMLNAVIGLAIAFGGYILISFLAQAVQVKPEFKPTARIENSVAYKENLNFRF